MVGSCRHLGWLRVVVLAADDVGCLTVMGSMWPSLIVESHPGTEPISGVTAARPGVRIDAFLFERSPWPFDEHIVQPSALAVHRGPDAGRLQLLREVEGCELAVLVRAEDLGFAMVSRSLFQGVDAKRSLHGVGNPPVYDGDQIQEAVMPGA